MTVQSPTGTLRVAIVGAGYVANHHVAALKRLDFVDIVGICDPNLPAAQALAARHGIDRVVPSLDQLAGVRPDVAYILTPPASHPVLAMEALDMGCHVLVEKPMADSAADCEAMIAHASARQRQLGVNHSDLFDPALGRALVAVRDGRIGRVLSVDVLRSSDYPAYGGGPLPATVTQGSYPLRDLGVHGLYTIEAFLGPIHRLRVDQQSRGGDPNLHFDEWQAHADTDHGIGRLLLSWNARPMENRVVVRGTAGIIEIDRFLQTCRVRRLLPGPKFPGIVLGAVRAAAADLVAIPWNVFRFAAGLLQPSPGIRRGAVEFATAIREGRPPPFTGEDALRIARLLDPACATPDVERREMLEARFEALQPVDALVTGAGGFVGRALVARLRAQGRRVRVLVRRPVAAFTGDPGVQVVVGDLGDPRIVAHAVEGAACVYHVGAAMRGSVRDFEAGTVWGTRNVVDACLESGTPRLVHVSSLSVLDHAGRAPDAVLTEASPYEPYPERRGAYTRTKLAAERIVNEAIREHGLPAVIVRPGQIFGPGAEQVTPNGTIALAGRWIAVGKAAQTLPLLYIDDAVDALLLAATVPAAVGRTFNVVDPAPVTQHDYLRHCRQAPGARLRVHRVPSWLLMLPALGVEMLGKLLHRDVPLSRYRVRSLRPLANFDGRAAREDLGWAPRVGAEGGLALTFRPRPPVTGDDEPSPAVAGPAASGHST
jgi:predicted dehydrogenase/nucleoside-diphosphate-sugar epimerase